MSGLDARSSTYNLKLETIATTRHNSNDNSTTSNHEYDNNTTSNHEYNTDSKTIYMRQCINYRALIIILLLLSR